MKKFMTQDRWTAVTCFVIAALVAVAIPSQTSDKPLPGSRGFDFIDGAFFPELAVILFAASAIWLFIVSHPRRVTTEFEASDEEPGQPDVSGEGEPPGMTLRDLFWAIGLSGGVLIYVQLLEPLGYLVATILGVLILAWVCGQRSLVGFFIGGVVFPAVVFYLFTRGFMVPLPRGELWSGF